MADQGGDEVRLRSGIEWRTVSGEVVALDLDSSAYLAVNDTGSLLWPLVASGATEGRLVEELVAHFDVDGEQARVDVAEFVGRLRALCLVEPSG